MVLFVLSLLGRQALALDQLLLCVHARTRLVLTGNRCNLVLKLNRQVPKEFVHVCHHGNKNGRGKKKWFGGWW